MKKSPLRKNDIALLARYGLDADDFPNAGHVAFAKGEYLSRAGENLGYIFFVISGKTKVMLSLSDGKQLLLAYFISQGIIGDIELMADVQSYHATLQAVTDFECVALPLQEYRAVLKGNATFINHVGRELAHKLGQRAVNGAINTLQPLEARLCAYILQTATAGQFTEPLTEVATMLGASYRHLLRCMEKLCTANILQKQGRIYKIPDPPALQAAAGDLYVL
jgi:CRP-like cAMP-binding protein